MPMKVAIIANVPIWILPGMERFRHGGHFATWLESLVPAFENVCSDLELHWITFSKEIDKDYDKEAFGQYFHILRRGSLAVSMVTRYWYECRAVRKIITKLNPDLVHAWGSEDVCGIAASRSGIKNKLFTLQGSLTDYFQKMGGSFLFRIQASYEKGTVKKFKRGTAESPMAAGLLKKLNPSMTVDIVEYGVNQDFHEAQWNPRDRPVVLFVGGIDERKGIRDLLQVAADPACRHLEFRLAGDGQLKSELISNSSSNVTWLGKCSRAKVVKELEQAWVLSIPTFADTGPTVVKEARVVGLPVVTTHAAGAASYIKKSGCGKIVHHSEPDELKAALLQICENREMAIEYGSRGHVEHRRILRSETTADCFRRIYQEMARVL